MRAIAPFWGRPLASDPAQPATAGRPAGTTSQGQQQGVSSRAAGCWAPAAVAVSNARVRSFLFPVPLL
jgi:hypothetical protein